MPILLLKGMANSDELEGHASGKTCMEHALCRERGQMRPTSFHDEHPVVSGVRAAYYATEGSAFFRLI